MKIDRLYGINGLSLFDEGCVDVKGCVEFDTGVEKGVEMLLEGSVFFFSVTVRCFEVGSGLTCMRRFGLRVGYMDSEPRDLP